MPSQRSHRSTAAHGAAVLLSLLLLGSAPMAPARAGEHGDRGDHERARRAVTTGQVLPLRTVLERLDREHPGQVLEVELEQDGGQWIYEVKLLQNDGQLVKLQLDARTAALLSRRARSGTPGTDRAQPR